MKSPMITKGDFIEDKGSYSDLMVLRSGAGFYVGTLWQERDAKGKIVYQEPGSRDSDYFPSHEAAASFLATLTVCGEDVAETMLRQHP